MPCEHKRRFATEAEAMAELRSAQAMAPYVAKRRECRYYWHAQCGSYHLTSMPLANPTTTRSNK